MAGHLTHSSGAALPQLEVHSPLSEYRHRRSIRTAAPQTCGWSSAATKTSASHLDSLGQHKFSLL
ncbi:hypothetical protein GBAR_LOCUS7537 [Geodia barretti]|uniref:Uncharacterized protein n=1 Tax=Geodia barretti TaxID=519541 RepID=A0AA35W872_GEOBA|nr:hypothetical protein GBAR_LOCUS7537 [Geodia barretti]